MSNRLKNEQSLYLLQHANNPVDWYPWGTEALEEARLQGKPILVSVGYSACHWCHVMARESFSDPYIAGIMNRHFICIKIDREERPDLDQLFMDAVQMIHRHGGWPLNVFCLPDGRPFFGGTYFPPEDRKDGLIPWPQLLMRVADHFSRKREDLEGNAKAITGNLAASNAIDISGGWRNDILVEGAKGLVGNHDDRYGGFGGAPKFPQPMALNFLDSVSRSQAVETGEPELAERIQFVTTTTLRSMAHGGLFDQFGGGFSRYSVDDHWLVPHFEKMLYDNAQLIETYTRAWLASRNPLFEAVVEETIAWIDREMSSPGGGLFAAISAESDGEEGRFYVWNPDEIAEVLGRKEAPKLCAAYHITDEGTFEDGRSVPALVEDDFELRQSLKAQRKALFAARHNKRTAPAKDRKINLAWNSLAVRALASAGFYFNRPEWLAWAKRIADFTWDTFSREIMNERRLRSVHYPKGESCVDGFLHDYALAAEASLAIAAFVDWMEPEASTRYIERAKRLVDAALKHFPDKKNTGFFFTADDAEIPVMRRKEWFDNATPSGNSALLSALVSLHALTGEERYAKEIAKLTPVFGGFAKRSASAVSYALGAICDHEKGVAVIKASPGSDLNGLREALASRPWRRTFVLISKEIGYGYQLCIGTACLEPVAEISGVVERT